MQQLASDLDSPDFAGAKDPDSMLSVKFYDYAAIDRWKTDETGIKTFKAACPFIQIAIPGNDKLTVERPADARDIHRFPKQWLYFQMETGKIANAENVPGWQIDEWEGLDKDQVRQLKHLRFYTVEQIAGANDAQVQGIGMGGPGLRTRAQQALEARNSSKTNTEIAKRDALIESQGKEIAEMKGMLQQLLENRTAPAGTLAMPKKA